MQQQYQQQLHIQRCLQQQTQTEEQQATRLQPARSGGYFDAIPFAQATGAAAAAAAAAAAEAAAHTKEPLKEPL
jgi:hypothetical protein